MNNRMNVAASMEIHVNIIASGKAPNTYGYLSNGPVAIQATVLRRISISDYRVCAIPYIRNWR